MARHRNYDAPHDNELLRPTYQNRLRVIGQHLDTGKFHNAAVFEVEGGFVARATPPDARRAQAMEFPDVEFSQLMQDALNSRGGRRRISHPSQVVPTGYEDLFRALGFALDLQSAFNITICELDQHALIAGMAPANNPTSHQAFRRFERYLTVNEVKQLLDEAFKRRTNPSSRFRLF